MHDTNFKEVLYKTENESNYSEKLKNQNRLFHFSFFFSLLKYAKIQSYFCGMNPKPLRWQIPTRTRTINLMGVSEEVTTVCEQSWYRFPT